MFIFMNEHYDGCMDEDSPGKKKAGEEAGAVMYDGQLVGGSARRPSCSDEDDG